LRSEKIFVCFDCKYTPEKTCSSAITLLRTTCIKTREQASCENQWLASDDLLNIAWIILCPTAKKNTGF